MSTDEITLDGSGSFWVRARFAAGLTHGQAARILGVRLSEIWAITEERADPLPWLAERMREVYGLDPVTPEGGTP